MIDKRGRLVKLLYLACRYLLLVIDEVGYILFEPEAVNLFFHVSNRHERASVIVTSSNQSGPSGEVFADEVVAAAMIEYQQQPTRDFGQAAVATTSRTAVTTSRPARRHV